MNEWSPKKGVPFQKEISSEPTIDFQGPSVSFRGKYVPTKFQEITESEDQNM